MLRQVTAAFCGLVSFFRHTHPHLAVSIAVKRGKATTGVSETWRRDASLHVCAPVCLHTAAGDLEFGCVILTVGRQRSFFFSLFCPYPEPQV